MGKTVEQSVGTIRREEQARNAQAKAKAAQPAAGRVTTAHLREALMWTEILGAPKCRKRHPTNARYSGK